MFVLAVTLAPTARAADDGNTQFKLNTAIVFFANDTADIVNTSGTGNLKAVRCSNISNPFTIQFTINGGTAQSITNFGDQGADSGWVPMNLRFTSSVRVRLVNGSGAQNSGLTCSVSWGLD